MVIHKKPIIYVGCSLTHASEVFRQEIEQFKNKLRPYAQVLDFLGLQHPNVEDVFETDIKYVKKCDALVAIVTYPSIGLGVEMGVAIENKKPIITLAQKGIKVSRFIYGYTAPQHTTYQYVNLDDAAVFVINKLQKLFPATV